MKLSFVRIKVSFAKLYSSETVIFRKRKIIMSLETEGTIKGPSWSYTTKGNNLLPMRNGQNEVTDSASAQMNVLAALLVSCWWEAAGGGW